MTRNVELELGKNLDQPELGDRITKLIAGHNTPDDDQRKCQQRHSRRVSTEGSSITSKPIVQIHLLTKAAENY